MAVYPLPDLEDIPFRPTREMGVRRIDWEPDTSEASIVRFEWNKQMGQPSGQWTAQIKARRDISSGDLLLNFDSQEVGDGDWVDIAIRRNGVQIPLCRGVVDSVRKQTRSAGGATVAIYNVTGRDHGAFFEYPITWNSIWAQTLNELVSGLFTRRIGGKVGGRPDELFEAIINGTFKGGTRQSVPSGQWILPQALTDLTKGEKLSDLLKIITFNAEKGGIGLRGAYFNEPGLWTVGEQPLHQTLNQWINPVLNEYWYDLLPPSAFMPQHGLSGFLSKFGDLPKGKFPVSADPLFADDAQSILQESIDTQSIESDNETFGTMGAFIRERPFPTTAADMDSMWFSLPTWVIPTWLLDSADLGRAGHQRFNLFELLGDFGIGPQQEQAAFSRPQWHKSDIFTHGLRTYSQTSRFFSQFERGPGGWLNERNRWLQILIDWFSPNPYLLQGTISAKIPLPEIRIGHRVILTNGNPQEDTQFYVEGVSLALQAPSASSGVRGSTSLILTRGFQGTDAELMKATRELSDLYQDAF
jgi:hypothetical protein